MASMASLQRLNECKAISHSLISAGMDCEEKRDMEGAVRLYKEGIGVINEGLGISFTANEWVQAKPIYSQLQNTYNTFRDRIEELYQKHRKEQEAEDGKLAAQLNQPWYSRLANWLLSDDSQQPTPTTRNTVTTPTEQQPPPPLHHHHRRSLSGSDISFSSSPSPMRNTNAQTSRTTTTTTATGRAAGAAANRQQNRSSQMTSAIASRPNTTPSSIGNERAQKISNWKNSPELRGVDSKILNAILNEVMDTTPGVRWSDIAGLESVKQSLWEAVILPSLRPELFTGLRAPPRGVLLFGPPGNGKTMLAKAVSSESKATFFNISASSLTSKWHGDGEKLVRALFGAARYLQPSVIFVDEIDSLLSLRSANEHEASRRLKTEFLVQMDGAGSNQTDRILIMGATNRPQELDEAVLRRFVKRILIPLPDQNSRITLVMNLLSKMNHDLKRQELDELALRVEGYSGSDLNALCREAAMVPLREMGNSALHASLDSIRPIRYRDFIVAMQTIRPSTLKEQLVQLERWSREFGSQR